MLVIKNNYKGQQVDLVVKEIVEDLLKDMIKIMIIIDNDTNDIMKNKV